MILVVVLTMAGHFKSVLSVFGTFGVLAAVVYTVVCVGLLGGPTTSTRGCWLWARRRETPTAAFVVAGQNFDDAKVIVTITVVLIVDFLMLLPFARILARGHSKKNG
jgi:BASS family bile acid:Na+ symporter